MFIPAHELRRFGRILVVFVLLAAAANVPVAVTFIPSRTAPPPRAVTYRGAAAERPWPAATPHAVEWPTPTSWDESRGWGYREYNVFARGRKPNVNNFQMTVQHVGWPLPVLEQKQMWWDWNDPALKGAEPDPRMRVMIGGLVFNPLIVGGGAFIVLFGRRILFVIRRAWRRRAGRCLFCGYPIRTPSPRCSECGQPVTPPSYVAANGIKPSSSSSNENA